MEANRNLVTSQHKSLHFQNWIGFSDEPEEQGHPTVARWKMARGACG